MHLKRPRWQNRLIPKSLLAENTRSEDEHLVSAPEFPSGEVKQSCMPLPLLVSISSSNELRNQSSIPEERNDYPTWRLDSLNPMPDLQPYCSVDLTESVFDSFWHEQRRAENAPLKPGIELGPLFLNGSSPVTSLNFHRCIRRIWLRACFRGFIVLGGRLLPATLQMRFFEHWRVNPVFSAHINAP